MKQFIRDPFQGVSFELVRENPKVAFDVSGQRNPEKELDEWCNAERGRRALVAKQIEASKGLVHDWRKGRRLPNIEQYFALKAFLKKQRRRSKRG